MITMVYDAKQLGAAAAGLERLSKAASDLTETMDVIGAYMVSSTQRRFQTQTGPGGVPWVQSLRARIAAGAAPAAGAPPAARAAPAAAPPAPTVAPAAVPELTPSVGRKRRLNQYDDGPHLRGTTHDAAPVAGATPATTPGGPTPVGRKRRPNQYDILPGTAPSPHVRDRVTHGAPPVARPPSAAAAAGPAPTGGKTTLLETGTHLRDRITHLAGRNEVEVGLNTPWAWVHQKGATIFPRSASALHFRLANGRWAFASKVQIPARPFLGIDQRDEQEIDAIVVEELERAVSGSPGPQRSST